MNITTQYPEKTYVGKDTTVADLQRALTAVTKEMDALKRERDEGYVTAFEVAMREGKAERDALRADAERYRWLRRKFGWLIYTDYWDCDAENNPETNGIRLDAAIDAAREGES